MYKLKNILNEYTYNILTLMSGTVISQGIPILTSPILTRLYSPEQFGLLATYVSIISILGSISSGRYELAIILPKNDDDAFNVSILGISIALLWSIILLFILLIFHIDVISYLELSSLSFWIFLVPLSVFMAGIYNVVTYFKTRKKKYKFIATVTAIQSISQSIIWIVFGLWIESYDALIIGQITSSIIACMILIFSFYKNTGNISSFPRLDTIIQLGQRYINFPKYSLPGVFANSLSQHLIILLISTIYGITILGSFSFMQRILALPASLLGNSVGQVFFQVATQEKSLTGKSLNSFKETFFKLSIISVITYGFLYFVIEDLFGLVFGEEWKLAGKYAKIAIPLFAIQFVSSPISILMTVFEKQKIGFLWQLSMLISMLSVMSISKSNNFDFIQALNLHVITQFLIYLIGLFICYSLAAGILTRENNKV